MVEAKPFGISKKRKYKKRGRSTKRAQAWLESVAYYRPELFAHWQFGVGFIAG